MVQFTAPIRKFADKGEKTGWSYITIPPDVAEELKPGFKKSFRVKGKLDKHPIAQLALLPMGNGEFILPLKAALRKAIHKNKGAMVEVQLVEDESKRKLAAELVDCLKDSLEADQKFRAMPFSHQMYYSNWISSGKTEPTRAKRIYLTILGMEKNMTFAEVLKWNAQTVDK